MLQNTRVFNATLTHETDSYLILSIQMLEMKIYCMMIAGGRGAYFAAI